MVDVMIFRRHSERVQLARHGTVDGLQRSLRILLGASELPACADMDLDGCFGVRHASPKRACSPFAATRSRVNDMEGRRPRVFARSCLTPLFVEEQTSSLD